MLNVHFVTISWKSSWSHKGQFAPKLWQWNGKLDKHSLTWPQMSSKVIFSFFQQFCFLVYNKRYSHRATNVAVDFWCPSTHTGCIYEEHVCLTSKIDTMCLCEKHWMFMRTLHRAPVCGSLSELTGTHLTNKDTNQLRWCVGTYALSGIKHTVFLIEWDEFRSWEEEWIIFRRLLSDIIFNN